MAKAKAKAKAEVEEIEVNLTVDLEVEDEVKAEVKDEEVKVEVPKADFEHEKFIKEYAEKTVEFNTIFDEEIFVLAGTLLAKINKVSGELKAVRDKRREMNIKNLELLVLKEAREIKVPKLKDGEKQGLVKTLQTIMKMKR